MSHAPAAADPRRTRRGRSRLRHLTRRDKVVVGVMIAIPLLLDLAFIWGPAVATVLYSFTNATGAAPVKWIGWTNYHTLATIDPSFWPAVRHNALWLGVFIVIATPLGMLFAVLLDRGLRGSRIYQSIFFLPVMLSLALIGIIWQVVYTTNGGLLNTLLGHESGGIDFLGDPKINLWAVLAEATWRQAGYVMVLYLSGLKAVDPALKESAALDGANGWQTFWHVVFPVLRPINAVIIVVTVIESLRAFDLVYITNQGGIGLQLISAMITQQITGPGNRIGYGSALGVILLLVSIVPICVFLVMQFRKGEQE
ncbi:sugar ABC transporter permease [Nocardioides sp. KR10-350]|uniref:carbohydrate ABC transporter permease n=1 Tax=Nocardioides cheoyonin TaxID=3156615 RepID=UPI0032B4A887